MTPRTGASTSVWSRPARDPLGRHRAVRRLLALVYSRLMIGDFIALKVRAGIDGRRA